MVKHECIHESDWGKVFTRIEDMGKAFDNQTIAMGSLKIAVDALLKYMYSMEAINGVRKHQSSMTWMKAGIIISSILGTSMIVTVIILKFIN